MDVTVIKYINPKTNQIEEYKINATDVDKVKIEWWYFCKSKGFIIDVDEIETDEEITFLSQKEFDYLLEQIDNCRKYYTIEQCLGCVYDLWRNSVISDDQEEELYEYIDPLEEHNKINQYLEELNKNFLKELIEQYRES